MNARPAGAAEEPLAVQGSDAALQPEPLIDVLLIEDDVLDEMATLRTVAAEGLPYRMHLARTLAQARAALARRSFDVILADCQLPDGSSFELMDTLAEQLVIFITGAWNSSVAARALRVGVHDYLIKDSAGNHLKLLHYRVETALRQRRLARRLRDSEARLQDILDNAPAAISARDLTGHLILSNRHHAAHGAPTTEAAPLDDGSASPTGCARESEETVTHSDGSEHTYLTVRFPMAGRQGRPQAVGAISVDITARKQAEQLIRELAFYDPLTALPNRRMLLDRLQQACATSARHGAHGAVFFIDLDHFKALNDTLGHDHGDLLLKEVARRLLGCVRGEDTVARIGGDEFVVMTVGLDSNVKTAAAQATVVGDKILAAVSRPCQLGVHSHTVTPSVGVTLFHGRDQAIEEVIKRADQAMYQAKAAGRGALRFFDPLMQASLEQGAVLEHDLRGAVQAGELRLYLQGQFDDTRGLVGAEVLLRWQHPLRGLLLPAQFLPVAEHTGMIVPIGRWVIDRACAQLARWARQGGPLGALRLAVNISSRQFRDAGFVDEVVQALQRHGVAASRLSLELREDLVRDNPAQTRERMWALHALGVGFVIDDFGIAYSSLSALRRLPLAQVKIPQALLQHLATDPHDAAVVRTIVGIAHSMGLGAAAAGVETLAQCELLRELGCSVWQGHYFGRPVPLAQFESLSGAIAAPA